MKGIVQFLEQATDRYERWRLEVEQKKKERDPRRLVIAQSYKLSKEQKEQIDDLFVKYYGEKIDYFWHQNYAAHAGRFDYRFFPEYLYIPEFEFYQNQNKAAVRMMEDKNFIPLVANSVGVRMPETILSCVNGLLRDSSNHIISEKTATNLLKSKPVFFVKPSIDSSSGQGCRKVFINDNIEVSDNTLTVNGEHYKRDFVVQEVIKCHESIQQIYPKSVNTFRVISYLWKGQIEVMPIIIRIGKGGSFIDNAHAGGMFCAVNLDGSMGNHAVTEFNEHFLYHPDTHIKFVDHRISHIDKIIEAAKRLHMQIPQIGVVNWDFTINGEGDPVLIESNCHYGSVWLPQMAHGTGAFGDKTAEVLKWLRFMKYTKPQNRKNYVGGLMD